MRAILHQNRLNEAPKRLIARMGTELTRFIQRFPRYSGHCGAGIRLSDGALTINGGTIHATGGITIPNLEKYPDAEAYQKLYGGAGIAIPSNASILITGGCVTAIGAPSGAGIGGCAKSGAAFGSVSISGGTVSVTGGEGAFDIGGGYDRGVGIASDLIVTGGKLEFNTFGRATNAVSPVFQNCTITGDGAYQHEGTYNANGKLTIEVTEVTVSQPTVHEDSTIALTAQLRISRTSNLTPPAPKGSIVFKSNGIKIGEAKITDPVTGHGFITANAKTDWIATNGQHEIIAFYVPKEADRYAPVEASSTYAPCFVESHDYLYAVSVDPTAATEGVLNAYCQKCQAETTITIPRLDSAEYSNQIIKEPSCTESGTARYTWKCTEYGTYFFDTVIPLLEHYYESSVTAPTCTAQGYITHTCSVCGDSYKDTFTAASGHNYIPARGVEATCTSPEMWEWQCTRCKDSYVVEGAPALGHNFRWGVDQEATVDAPGYQHEECTHCHATRNENTLIPVLNHVCDGGDSCPGSGFSDMPAAGNWAHAGIDYCVSHGLMNGVGKGQFDPNGTLTRAMLVTVLYRVQGEPDVSGLENPFEDVPDGMWYTEPIIWAASKQVVNGTSAATFEPDAPITREQIAAILYRYAKEVEGADVSASAALDGFADAASVSAYARTPLGWASALGYIKGSNENGTLLLNPQGNATRAEVATILMRYLER